MLTATAQLPAGQKMCVSERAHASRAGAAAAELRCRSSRAGIKSSSSRRRHLCSEASEGTGRADRAPWHSTGPLPAASEWVPGVAGPKGAHVNTLRHSPARLVGASRKRAGPEGAHIHERCLIPPVRCTARDARETVLSGTAEYEALMVCSPWGGCGRGSSGADVGEVSPVAVQMRQIL